ncbi:MAG: hypothetical protein KC731_02565 [Myxococcales bacterium]|nr:hypothetical protein [Myxococcales bacterium]
MELRALPLADKYRRILDTCEPFLISYPANWPFLDLNPFGITITEDHRYTATSLRSRGVVDGLHQLDAVTFGDQEMLMPRWVMFDCGEFPGIVVGFGRRARDLPLYAREAYRVVEDDDAFVPLSMWVAIRCAEEGAWFGHNLSSANLILKGDERLGGLATLVPSVGVKVSQSTRQYGATQWTSKSIDLHNKLGRMHILSAYTPAHTHPETLAYRIDVNEEELVQSLLTDYEAPSGQGERVIDPYDHHAIRALHDEIERGAEWYLLRTERQGTLPAKLHLNPVGARD